ncbi:MAG: DUF4423 domain-containing protein [Bdellovibrionota bacterium]|nr:DUF4423 domain-containing protein [Bdellovibrionota bacterium]
MLQAEQIDNFNEDVLKPKVTDFSDYADFLNSYVSLYGKYGHGPYNLQNWALRLGYKSPSSLTMVLKKKRLPTYKMVVNLCDDFGFSKDEREYFETLVEIEKNIEKGKDIQKLLEKAKSLSGKSEYQKVSLEQFSLVSDWYCYAVKALIARKDFVNDLDWMERALRRKVTKAQIKGAIYNLLKVGFVEECEERGLKVAKGKTHTGNGIPSAAIKNHHRGMVHQASQAIDEQSVEERIFQGLTLNIDKEKDKEEAFSDIMKFIQDFNSKYRNDEDGESTYQLNIQFFELAKKVELDG